MAGNWIRSENVVWEELDGGALLINAKSGERWTLNATGLALWKLCDGSRAVEMCSSFFGELKSAGLLQSARFSSGMELIPSGVFARSAMPTLEPVGLGLGARRRPSPRGNSGPG